MRVTRTTSKTRRPSERPNQSRRDALRVSLALVFILFASIASRDHETPEKVLEAREIATSTKEERTSHLRDQKQKLSEPSFLKRLTGINGAI